MLHKEVHHHVGLSVVMGALVAAWFTAAVPALQTQAALSGILAEANKPSDFDRDGIADKYDAYQVSPGPRAWREKKAEPAVEEETAE